ncbi:heterokaryon incompatibility protein-domain-containing protein [Lophiotrema nucula]|uniref:Heterokaryon incompatibility protein-domain-containing protein n=1 Tax=Lophiotrema nucula TaxID=690887 RepID=A0A6A5Z3Y0_9PLEO|nr:heterokaryon incompatibility protein-domain-containing protein [Lophiotrema nucula]
MYLIRADTYILEDFQGRNIPKYAILSHTWTDEEISFSAMHTLNNSLHTRTKIKQKEGFYKIKKTCDQAMADGINHVWVDTCCIDKGSSAHLSEAINSMWRYYREAEVCYAYLSDIDVFDALRMGDVQYAQRDVRRFWTNSINLISEKDLSKAKWFSRGWTLQELIAPKNVVFYIKGWNFVGNKASMKEKLSRITGIDEITLANCNLESVSVARRMSWASKRVTTRVEDIAYCLLGIFDVNMPLLYGEGEKAFVRLQEEIMKDSEDQSLFAWRPPNAFEVWDLELLTPTDVEGGRGIFARHPSEFADARAVRPSSSRGEPYTLTNKGVRMEIPILPLERSLFLAIFECHYEGDLSQQLSIVVQKLHGGSQNQFVRHDGAGLIKVSHDMVRRAKIATVYLVKKVPSSRDFTSVYRVFNTGSQRQVDVLSYADATNDMTVEHMLERM